MGDFPPPGGFLGNHFEVVKDSFRSFRQKVQPAKNLPVWGTKISPPFPRLFGSINWRRFHGSTFHNSGFFRPCVRFAKSCYRRLKGDYSIVTKLGQRHLIQIRCWIKHCVGEKSVESFLYALCLMHTKVSLDKNRRREEKHRFYTNCSQEDVAETSAWLRTRSFETALAASKHIRFVVMHHAAVMHF